MSCDRTKWSTLEMWIMLNLILHDTTCSSIQSWLGLISEMCTNHIPKHIWWAFGGKEATVRSKLEYENIWKISIFLFPLTIWSRKTGRRCLKCEVSTLKPHILAGSIRLSVKSGLWVKTQSDCWFHLADQISTCLLYHA